MSEPYAPGTVVRYISERTDYWCREGMAVAGKDGRLVDTYWESTSDAHVLTAAEQATVTVEFCIGDYRELDRHERHTWEDYHSDDRQEITAQHGLRRRLFIRIGAEPDLDTRIENAREAVRLGEGIVARAESNLARRREVLAELLVEQNACPGGGS